MPLTAPLPPMPLKTCERCGRSYAKTRKYSVSMWARRRYCSTFCRSASGRRSFYDHFWNSVTKGPTCWEWNKTRQPFGYGRVYTSSTHAEMAHRVSWMLFNGPIPDGLFVLHRCDNPPCVRPDHLFLGTIRDNQVDSMNKGRNVRGTMNPRAKLDPDKVRSIRALYASGQTKESIAAMFGVSSPVIRGIVNGTGWSHVV